MPVAAVLLAGGQATRMGGGDKPLVTLAGRPLLAHVIERVAPQVDLLVLNVNGDPARFSAWRLPLIVDPIDGHVGPLAGILAGMRWAALQGAETLLSVSTDTPFLPLDLVARLQSARRTAGQPLACAASGGWAHPVIGLWPVELADTLAADLRKGVRKIDAWTARHGVGHADFPNGPFDPFFNVNRPDDLAEAERLIDATGGARPILSGE